MKTKAIPHQKNNVGSATITLAALIVLVALMGTTAHAGQPITKSQAIFQNEVMKACRHKTAGDAVLFISAAPFGRLTATPEQEKQYITSDANYQQAAKKSKCWTRERWERYVHAVLEEQRAEFGKFENK